MAEITGNRPESCNGGYALNSRRGFFKISIAALASLIGIVAGIPVLRSVLPPVRQGGDEWNKLDALGSLPAGTL